MLTFLLEPPGVDATPFCFRSNGAEDDLPYSSCTASSDGSIGSFREVADGDGNVSRELSGLGDDVNARHMGRWAANRARSGSLDDSTEAGAFR